MWHKWQPGFKLHCDFGGLPALRGAHKATKWGCNFLNLISRKKVDVIPRKGRKKSTTKRDISLAKEHPSCCISMTHCKQEKDRNFSKEKLQISFVMESIKQLKSRHCWHLPLQNMKDKSVNLENIYKPNKERKSFWMNLLKLRATDLAQALLLIRTGKPSLLQRCCFVILKRCEGQRDRGWVLIGITSRFCSSLKAECYHLVQLRTLEEGGEKNLEVKVLSKWQLYCHENKAAGTNLCHS